jgi:peptidoglycan/LPS O-acetylase OafA/YrhL
MGVPGTERDRAAAGERSGALDGLRAVAVGLVLAYHGGVPGLGTAGYFGVDVFFVLSGYLITTLLLGEVTARGRIGLTRFWARRARRLVPGLVLMLMAVDVYVSCFAPAGAYPGFRGDALSVVAYFSNWHLIAQSSNYFASSGPASLLTHTWSLAIEEQFYVVWPLAVWALARAAWRLGRSPATAVGWVSGLGAVASGGWMAYLYRCGASVSRLYYGTDTHAQGILLGAALAAATFGAARRAGGGRGGTARPSRRTAPAVGAAWLYRRTAPAVGAAWLDRLASPTVTAAAAAGLAWAACRLGYADPATYQGGFLLVSALSALLVLGVVRRPAAAPARLLSTPPLAWTGRISYGMYLWYFPLFAVADHARTGLSGPALFALRVAADVVLAAVSFHLVELPVRHWAAGPARPAPTGPARPAPTGPAGPAAPAYRHRGPAAPLAGAALALATVTALVLADAPPALSSPALSTAALSSPALLSPAPTTSEGHDPAASTDPQAGRPAALRILVAGDSTGVTLALALAWPGTEARYGYRVYNAATLGCGLAVSTAFSDHGSTDRPPPPCRTSTPAAGQWPALLAAAAAADHPDVILLAAGRWEVRDRQATPGGPWLNITQPADAAYVKSQMEVALGIAARAGAVLGLATAPCYDSGETPSGGTWPEDSPGRVAAYNALVRSVADAHPGRVRVVDLYSMVCPGGHFHTRLDGLVVRTPDGVHYPFFSVSAPGSPDPDTAAEARAFGAWIAPRILASLGSPTRPGP